MGSLELEYSCKVIFLGNAFPEICKAGHDFVRVFRLVNYKFSDITRLRDFWG